MICPTDLTHNLKAVVVISSTDYLIELNTNSRYRWHRQDWIDEPSFFSSGKVIATVRHQDTMMPRDKAHRRVDSEKTLHEIHTKARET